MIEVYDLKKNYPQRTDPVVNDISFKIKPGEIACLIGPSGCGKTTTLKMINRLVEPSQGEVFINGKSCFASDPVTWRRNIGYVIQKGGLLPHLNIYDNISLLSKVMQRPSSEIKNRVEELMDLIGLEFNQYAQCFPKELSGGQQQRVGIARALMENPPVILMDEPFSALDPISKNSLYKELIDLNQKLGKTILIVTHDMNEAKKLGDKILLLNSGKLEQMGTFSQLQQSPNNEFVSQFLEAHQYG